MAEKASSPNTNTNSNTSPTTTNTPLITTCNKSFYLNLLLLNKEELIASKVIEKTGKGFFGKAVAYTANKLISDDKIITNMADKIITSITKTINELGIEAEFSIKFQQGAFIVIHIEVVEVDTLTLILSAKGTDFATHFTTLLHTVEQLGMSDIISTKVNEKINVSIINGMMNKFSELIPIKMLEQGINVECITSLKENESEIFFDIYSKINK
jgi:hypothetical protein